MSYKLNPETSVAPEAPAAPAHPMREESESIEQTVPELLAEVYAGAELPLRARLLRCLLRPVGPLGLVSVAAGAFGMFLQREAWQQLAEPLAESLRFTADQVRELAALVAQVQPEAFAQLPAILADHSFGTHSVSVSLLMIALRPLLRDRPDQAREC